MGRGGNYDGGVATTEAGVLTLGHGTHACWHFESEESRRRVFPGFVADGVSRGEAVMWIGRDGDEDLLSSLEPDFDVDALLRSGQVVLADAERTYPKRDFDVTRRVDGFAWLADEASGRGYNGLRVFADSSSLPERLGATTWTRYELAVSRMIASRPLLGVCGFDASGERGMATIDALHPASVGHGERPSPFHLRPGPRGSLVVAGEIDHFSSDEARTLLTTALRESERAVLDLSEVTFTDAAGTSAVLGAALATGAAVRGATPTFRKLSTLLGYRDAGRIFSD